MNLIKIVPASLLLLACVAPAQQNPGPPQKPDVYLQNDRPKNQKDSNTRTIQGTVKDSSDNPLAGAIVQFEGHENFEDRRFSHQGRRPIHFQRPSHGHQLRARG